MTAPLTTIVEITETHIKIAQVRTSARGSVLTRLLIEPLSSSVDEIIASRVHALIKKIDTRSSVFIMVVARSVVIIREITVPSVHDDEIAKMVELQVVRQVPYAREDISVGHTIVERGAAGYSKVLLVVAHKNVVNRYLKIAEGISSREISLAFSSQGICAWYNAYAQQKGAASDGGIIVVDIDTGTTDICFMSGRQLVSSRALSFGMRDIGADGGENIFRQFAVTLASYKKEHPQQELSRIVVTAPGNVSAQFISRLQAESGLAVETVDSQIILSLEKGAGIPAALTAGEVSVAALLGCALADPVSRIELLPADIHRRKDWQLRRKEYISFVIIVTLGCVAVAAVIAAQIQRKHQYIAALEDSIRETTPQAKSVEVLIKKLDLMHQRLSPQRSSIDILYELYDCMPEGVSLSSFELNEQGGLALQGMAVVMSDVFNFQSALGKSSSFRNVEVKYTSKRRMRQGEATDFRITCQVVQ